MFAKSLLEYTGIFQYNKCKYFIKGAVSMENEVLELMTQCLTEDRLQRLVMRDKEYQSANIKEREVHDDFESTLSLEQKELYDSFIMASSETQMNLVRIVYQQGMKDLYNLLQSLEVKRE
jgi:hypothetical protein